MTSARRAAPQPRVAVAVLVAAAAVLVAGCGGDEPLRPTPAAAASGATPPEGVPRTVLLDPGHNGGNKNQPIEIARKVPDGRGGTKPCNTVGTATDAGFPEHKFAWDVTLRVRQLLMDNGVNVKLTRRNDTGFGPCVDTRGKMAAEVDADLMVSIHADGAPPEGRGFHVAYPKPALNKAQGTPSLELATALRDALRGAGLPTSTYIGKQGLVGRSDLAGLNHSKRPVALVECANMRNPEEAVTVANGAGRQRYATAITIGILNWLKDHPSTESASASASASVEPSTTRSANRSSSSSASNRSSAGSRSATASDN